MSAYLGTEGSVNHPRIVFLIKQLVNYNLHFLFVSFKKEKKEREKKEKGEKYTYRIEQIAE